MATLTYNPNETPDGELTAEEQDSLAVGEKAIAQQQELLAGKFKDAEELEKAYVELQKKFGSRNTDSEDQEESSEESSEVEDGEEEVESDENILDRLWQQGVEGKFSEEILKELNSLSPADIAKMYLEYRVGVESAGQEESDDGAISDKEAASIRGIVGGDKEYQAMVAWASENLSEDEIKAYDSVMETGDKNAVTFAVQALNSKYQEATGVEGNLLTGKAAKSTRDVFRSQAEVVRAMSDPRYDNDPAYRQDVFAKLERSNLEY